MIQEKIKFGLIIIAVFAMFISACTILPWIKDPNVITDWISVPAEDTEYEYKESLETYYNGELQDSETNYHSTLILDVNEKEDIIIIKTETKRDTVSSLSYILIDKQESVIAYSSNQLYEEEYDEIMLETPVEIGNEWNYGDNYEMEIININATKETSAGTFSDCVVIELKMEPESSIIWEMWYSPSIGNYVYFDIYGSFSYDGNTTEIIQTIELIDIDY